MHQKIHFSGVYFFHRKIFRLCKSLQIKFKILGRNLLSVLPPITALTVILHEMYGCANFNYSTLKRMIAQIVFSSTLNQYLAPFSK